MRSVEINIENKAPSFSERLKLNQMPLAVELNVNLFPLDGGIGLQMNRRKRVKMNQTGTRFNLSSSVVYLTFFIHVTPI